MNELLRLDTILFNIACRGRLKKYGGSALRILCHDTRHLVRADALQLCQKRNALNRGNARIFRASGATKANREQAIPIENTRLRGLWLSRYWRRLALGAKKVR